MKINTKQLVTTFILFLSVTVAVAQDLSVLKNVDVNSLSDDKIKTIDSCEYIWEAGVGFSNSPAQNYQHDYNRTEILKLLLATFSETIYLPPLSKQLDNLIKKFTFSL